MAIETVRVKSAADVLEFAALRSINIDTETADLVYKQLTKSGILTDSELGMVVGGVSSDQILALIESYKNR